MGGYGSLKFGLKYPELFSLVGSFSGALEAAKFTEKNAGNIGKTTDLIFGAEDGDVRKQNDIYTIVKEMSSKAVEKLPFIYLDCGTEDFLFASNRSFVALLTEKKIPHEYRELPGGHTWPYWNSQVKEFLEVADLRLEK
jgi:S-formylglutathione hydrolase FrmB